MDKNAHKSHHYIPQCYLKNFSENGICLFVYNKDYSKSYVQAINKTCCIKDFYTLPKIYCENQLEPLFLECEYFAKEIEPKYSVLLNKILAKEREWMLNRSNNIKVLSSEEKFEFANYLTIQWYTRQKWNFEWNLQGLLGVYCGTDCDTGYGSKMLQIERCKER